VTKLHHQTKDHTNRWSFLNFCEILQRYQNSGGEKANSAARLEILRPTENCGTFCGPYLSAKLPIDAI